MINSNTDLIFFLESKSILFNEYVMMTITNRNKLAARSVTTITRAQHTTVPNFSFCHLYKQNRIFFYSQSTNIEYHVALFHNYVYLKIAEFKASKPHQTITVQVTLFKYIRRLRLISHLLRFRLLCSWQKASLLLYKYLYLSCNNLFALPTERRV